jgi:hypothetical protein
MVGKIRDIIPAGARTILSLDLSVPASRFEKYTGKDLSVVIKPYTAHRSLSQNAYYWELLTQVASHRAVRTSTARQHNLMLRQHPRFETISGTVVNIWLKDSEDTEKEVLESIENHLYPTSYTQTNSKGVVFRCYYMMRGSRSYTTAEMSVLLDDLIVDAKELGIETATPDELARMREYDRQKEARKSEQGKGQEV